MAESTPDTENKIYYLNGPWDFYWKKHLLPGQEPEVKADAWLENNLLWTDAIDSDGKKFASIGHATYRIIIKDLPASKENYIFFPALQHAAQHIFIIRSDNQNVIAELKLGDINLEGTMISRQSRSLQFRIEKTTDIIVLIHVTNHQMGVGGLWGIPQLEIGERILSQKNIQLFVEITCFGMIWATFLSNLLIWWNRRSNFASFWVAFCALITLSRIISTSQFIINLFPESWGNFLYRLEHMSIPMFAAVAIYLDHVFPSNRHVKFSVLCNSALSILIILYISTSSPEDFVNRLPIFHLQVLFTLLIALTICWLSIKNKSEGSRINIIGVSIMAAFAFNDIVLVTFYGVHTTFILPLSFAIYVSLQSQIVANRFAKNEQLLASLAKQNAEFESLIRRETEMRFNMASSAAHNLNNPLNYIQTSLDYLKALSQSLHHSLELLLGKDATDDPKILQCRAKFSKIASEFNATINQANLGIKRVSHTIAQIRILSGIDGHSFEYFELRELAKDLEIRLKEIFGDEIYHRLIISQDSFDSKIRLGGNRTIFIHIFYEVLSKALLNSNEKIQINFTKSNDHDGFEVILISNTRFNIEAVIPLTDQLSYMAKSISNLCILSIDENLIRILIKPALHPTTGMT